MAKPIRKTPELKGKYANAFLEEMHKTQRRRKTNARERELLQLAELI